MEPQTKAPLGPYEKKIPQGCWFYFPADKLATPEELSNLISNAGLAIGPECISVRDLPGRERSTVLMSVPFESIEYLLQWVLKDSKLRGFTITPKKARTKEMGRK